MLFFNYFKSQIYVNIQTFGYNMIDIQSHKLMNELLIENNEMKKKNKEI